MVDAVCVCACSVVKGEALRDSGLIKSTHGYSRELDMLKFKRSFPCLFFVCFISHCVKVFDGLGYSVKEDWGIKNSCLVEIGWRAAGASEWIFS